MDLLVSLIFAPLTTISFGMVWGIVPPWIYGYLGGDEQFEVEHPTAKAALKLIHHWQIGIIIMIIGIVWHPFILGWGVGTTIDDLLFHSFEGYFARAEPAE
jgi:hypothetical protein